MENINKPSSKIIKNPLLQTSNYGFPFDSLRTNSMVVPVSKKPSSSLTETAEIDNFIGQDSSPQESVALNSIVNENQNQNQKKNTSQQSVPLVVPSSGDCNAQPSNGRQQLFASSSSVAGCRDHIFAPPNNTEFNSTSQSQVTHQFFDPARNIAPSTEHETLKLFNPQRFDNANNNRPPISFSSPSSSSSSAAAVPVPPAAAAAAAAAASGSSNNNYRLGNLKRPTYAPVPGLSSTTHASPQSFATPFTPSVFQNQSSNHPVEVCIKDTAERTTMNSLSGPYNSTTTTTTAAAAAAAAAAATTSGDSSAEHRPPTMSAEKSSLYRPVYHHWFYRKDMEKNWFYQKEGELKSLWKPFSMADSLALERAYSLPTLNEETVVPTDGGRYDVNVVRREKTAVYWDERKSVVRRCSWLSKGYNDSYFIPYEEHIAAKLEEEYKLGMITGLWNRKIDVGNEEVIMHNMSLITHQIKSANVTIEVASDSSIPSQLKPRIVKRGGFDDFDIDDGEPEKIDHLLFLVHGIGQFCDLKFRSIIEVVDEFRSISLQLTQSHFQESCELGEANRIEILPVSWHKALHSEDTGIDKRLKNITLPSIPRLRDFSNDTILDVLFYTSPVFCQVIINAVVSEMNRLYALFRQRNPEFNGKVSIGGHSLGSIIVFDLLNNQPTTPSEPEPDIADDLAEEYDKRLTTMTRRISVVTIGKAGTGQPLIKYPRLNFHPRFFFAFGSPIACFVATRSNEILGEDFKFPTCEGFFNIFHPYDPIAYRVEPLVIPSLSTVKPVQVPHHKGRKRMHLELKDTVSHVGQRLIDTVKNTWNMVYHLAINKSVDAAESVIQHEINHVLQTSEALSKKPVNPNLVPNEPVNESTDVKVGCLNEGKRIDYVLQEAPVEYFNEYLFALASHLCYWTSRDTMLLVLKEIYGDMGIYTDNQIPQTILPFDITDGETSEEYYDRNATNDPTSSTNESIHLYTRKTSS